MSRKRATVAVATTQCCLCIIILFTSLSLATQQLDNNLIQDADDPGRRKGNNIRRRLSLSQSSECKERPPPKIPTVPNLLEKSATYAVSFPGSGDRMITKYLVETITGMLVGEASISPSLERMKAQHMDRTGFARGQGEVIVLRTNFPHIPTGKLSAYDYDIHRAFIILRNPLTAIPCYFDQLYELNSHVPAGDSSVETTDVFIKWRDNQLNDQLLLWQRYVSFWMEKFENDDNSHRVFFSYESLIDATTGAQEAVRLAQFLHEGIRTSAMEQQQQLSSSNTLGAVVHQGPADSVDVIAEAVKSFADTNEIFCIWKEMTTSGSRAHVEVSLSQRSKDRPFTTENLLAISTMLLGLIDRWRSSNQQVVEILTGYCNEVLKEYQKQLTDTA